MAFSCPACGAPLTFEGEFDALACGACGYAGISPGEGELTPAARKLSEAALEQGATSWGAERTGVDCEGCGAEVSLDPAEIATRCPFCASPALRPAGATGGLRPSLLGAFRVDAEEARGRGRAWLGGGWMFPGSLREVGLEGFIGVYLPYWAFSAAARAPWSAEVGHEEVERRGRRVERRIVWRRRQGTVETAWSHLLVPATDHVAPSLLGRIEPFDPDALRPFRTEQLAGWQAHGFDVPLATAWGRAHARMLEACTQLARERIGAAPVRGLQLRMFLTQESFAYVLLPVWVSTYHYAGRTWQVLVNAHTGVVEGHRPVVWLRVHAVMAACLLPALLSLAVPPAALVLALLGAIVAAAVHQSARRAEGPPA